MINNTGDIITEVLVRNNRTTTDGFITDAMLQDWVREAHTWASSVFKWPFTEGRASTTYTTSVTDDNGLPYTTYPEGWKADSIRLLTVGGKRMTKLDFGSFLRFLEDQSQDTSRVFSDYGRQIYVNVNADVSGTMTAYGQYSPIIDPTDLTSTTVFSGYDEEGNEAILEKITSYIKRREHLPDEAELHDQRASAKLAEVWKRVQDEQYNYQTKDRPMFEDFDVLKGRGTRTWFKSNQF